MTLGKADPPTMRAIIEYLLMAETGLTPEQIAALPEKKVALYAAIAEWTNIQRAKRAEAFRTRGR